MAQPNKKRQRELRQDRFRETTINAFDRLGDQLEGRGRTILYGLAAVVALAMLAGLWSWWSGRRADEARRALGRAIEIAEARVDPSPAPGATAPGAPTFPSERERAQKAVEEFQSVAAKYPDPYREKARYFAAVNLLTLDRNRGLNELEALAKNAGAETAGWAKFALAQAREADGQYDAAAALYSQLAKQADEPVPHDTVNLRLATIYEKQGKKKEAADLLFQIVESSRKAKDQNGKPLPESPTVRDAAQKLESLDPARFAQLPPEPPASNLPF